MSMQQFDCRAIDRADVSVRLRISAETRARACQMLEARGLFPVNVQPIKRGVERAHATHRRALKDRELEYFATEMSALLEAKVALDTALAFIAEDPPSPVLAGVAADLRDSLRSGLAFSSALDAHPARFPKFFVGLAIAGEAGGHLDRALAEVARHMVERRKLVQEVRGKLAYPAFLATGALLSLVMLATVVFPAFSELLSQTGAELPALTRAVISAGSALRDYGALILAALLALALGLAQILRTPRGKALAWGWLYAAPMIGPLMSDLMAARFANTLAALLQGGVRLADALALTSPSIGDPVASDAIERARLAVREGEPLTDALSSERLFPARLIHMLRVGETSGDLEAMVGRAAQFHSEQARRRIAIAVAVINPATTLVMGLLIGLMVSSLMSALLNLNPGGL